MLAAAKTVEVVADTLKEFGVKNIVLDPVRLSYIWFLNTI